MLEIHQIQISKFSATKIKLKLTFPFETDAYLAASGDCFHGSLDVLTRTRAATILVRLKGFSNLIIGPASVANALRCGIAYEGTKQAHDLDVILRRMLVGKAL